MKISGSILSIKDNSAKIDELINSGIDLLHLDVMDGKFVDNYSLPYEECLKINNLQKLPLDVHIMVQTPKQYIEKFINLKPKYITFHVETDNVLDNINYLKQNNISVGLAINPETNIDELLPYLDKIDLVLVMSVQPGYGGQAFINSSLDKINYLNNYKVMNNLNYQTEIDGGVNTNNIQLIKSDIVVIGSTITKTSNYKEEVEKIGELI